MKTNRIISILIIGFAAVCFLLYLLGIINLTSEDLIGYSFIIIGLALYLSGFGSTGILQIFFGSAFFLAGILLIIIRKFPPANTDSLVLPSVILLLGFSFLMVFIHNRKLIVTLVLSLLGLITGMYVLISNSAISASRFTEAFNDMISGYWPVLIIFFLITLLLWQDK